MRHFLVAILILCLCRRWFAQEQASISRRDRAGLTVVSPSQSGWRLLKSDKSETVFEHRDKEGILRAEVKTITRKTFSANKDMLASLETLKQEELNKLRQDSIHFNYVRFKRTSCLQYDGILKIDLTSSPEFSYLNLNVCPFPGAKDLIDQMEFSAYATLRGFSEAVSDLSDEFVEKIVFP